MSITTMTEAPLRALEKVGLHSTKPVHYQLTPSELTEQAVQRKEAVLNDTGALLINTGEFTGRSPKDKFTVKDELTTNSVHWNDFNIPLEPKYFDQMYDKLVNYLNTKEIWVRDCYACADPAYRLNVRVINENPWSNLFA